MRLPLPSVAFEKPLVCSLGALGVLLLGWAQAGGRQQGRRRAVKGEQMGLGDRPQAPEQKGGGSPPDQGQRSWEEGKKSVWAVLRAREQHQQEALDRRAVVLGEQPGPGPGPGPRWR